MSEAHPADGDDGTTSPIDRPALAPIVESRRIDAMDVLRGFALIGILFMNIEWFGRPIGDLGTFDESLTGLDHGAGWLVRCLIEGKFYKLFALLFGMGFAVMLIRAREAGRPFGWWFIRRMSVLLVIGLLHMIFIWPGDILHDYATAGFVLLGWVTLMQKPGLKRFDHAGAYLKTGLVWLSFMFVAVTLAAIAYGVGYDHAELTERWQEERDVAALVEEKLALPAPPETADDAEDPDGQDEEDLEPTREERVEERASEIADARRLHDERVAAEIAAYTQPSWLETTKFRASQSLRRLQSTIPFTLIILMPIFLIGYWFVASGVLRNHRQNRHIFRPMAWIGSVFGLFFTVAGLILMQYPTAMEQRPIIATGSTIFLLGQYLMSAGYLGIIVMLLGNETWRPRLQRLAPMGRMALTNYIMQTAILAVLFHGYGFGLWGEVARAPQMLLATAILVLQGFLSTWWLRRYRFGPLEWLWRSATYWSLQPMRLPVPPAVSRTSTG